MIDNATLIIIIGIFCIINALVIFLFFLFVSEKLNDIEKKCGITFVSGIKEVPFTDGYSIPSSTAEDLKGYMRAHGGKQCP